MHRGYSPAKSFPATARRSGQPISRLLTAGWWLAFAALLLCVLGYRVTRHFARESNVARVLYRAVALPWEPTGTLPAGLGAVVRGTPINDHAASQKRGFGVQGTARAWSSLFVTADGVRTLYFQPGPAVHFEQTLVSRRVENLFGTEVLRWHCHLQGTVTPDTGQYDFRLLPAADGDAGYSVAFSGSYEPREQVFTLGISERLWSQKSRCCALRFKLNLDGTLHYLGPTSQQGESGGRRTRGPSA